MSDRARKPAAGESSENEDASISPVDCLRIIRAIFSDRDLTMGEAVVIAIAVLLADGRTGETWPAYQRIAQEFGLSQATIRAGLKAGEGRYLRAVRRGRAGAVCYEVSSPQDEELHGAQFFTRRAPVLHFAPGSSSRGEDILAISSSSSSATPPSPPPAAGGVCASSSKARPDNGKPQDRERGAAAQAVARIGEAYRAVFDAAMPGNWGRRVRREASNGSADLLALVDADCIRGGIALAKRAGRQFGFGWVLRAAEAAAARRAERKRAGQASADRTRAQADARAAEERRQAERSEAVRATWEGLTPDQRDGYRRRAMANRIGRRQPERVEPIARELAFAEAKR